MTETQPIAPPPHRLNLFRRGIGVRGKILLFGLAPMLLLLGIIVAIELYSVKRDHCASTEDLIVKNTAKAAGEIERGNIESVTICKVMALAQENGLFGRRKESVEYARSVLEMHPQLTGSYFGYEPNADGQDEASLQSNSLPKGSMVVSGRFIPYWFRAKTNEAVLQLTPLVDMETSYYYQGVKNRFLRAPEAQGIILSNGISKHYKPSLDEISRLRPMITEPYEYEGKFMIEQTYPIIINGEFKGIAGVDRALGYLDQFLEQLKPFKTAEFILISRRGRIISSSVDRDLRGQPIENTPYAEILRDLYQSPKSGVVSLKEDPVLKKPSYVSCAPLPIGNWRLVMMVSQTEVMQPVYAVMRRVLILTGIGALTVLLIVTRLARSISSRVGVAVAAAKHVAAGDLTVKISGAESKDEVGQLLRSIQAMVQALNSLVSQVKQSSIQLISTATQIGAAARQQESTTQNFGTSSNEIAAAVKEISATSQELLGTMDDVTKVTSETSGLANTGRSSLGGMEAAMQHLAQATGSISSKLSVINERAGNIGSVITTITKVADQTNLLSLNAAIEAEKAGEYGLGFGVVAREIRRLADQTAVATLDIEQMVKEMQSSVSSGVMEMEKFAEEVRRGVQETARISSQFGKIIEQVERLTPRFEAVHEGMQSQSQGASQISDAMINLTDAARQSSSSVQEFQQATGQLHEAVRLLKDEISRFKIS